MAHDVFISYSSHDRLTATAVCVTLENRGVRCWIAPWGLLPGMPYGESLIDALKGSRILVLAFSSHANASNHVRAEIDRAVNRGIPIIPFRIEGVIPSGAMEYYLSARHWLDAVTPPLERHLEYLGETVTLLLSRSAGTEYPGRQPLAAAESTAERNPPPLLWPPITANASGGAGCSFVTLYELKWLSGQQRGVVIPLSRERLVAGRNASCDIALPIPNASRQHFALDWESARHTYIIRVFGSLETYVNGQFVQGTLELVAGDVIEVGNPQMEGGARLVFREAVDRPRMAIQEIDTGDGGEADVAVAVVSPVEGGQVESAAPAMPRTPRQLQWMREIARLFGLTRIVLKQGDIVDESR